MAGRCSVCSHDRREEIDHLLVGGTSYRDIVKQMGDISISALSRHNNSHVSAAIQRVEVERQLEHGATLLERVETLLQRVEGIIDNAEAASKPSQQLAGIAEARRILELMGKVSGELRESPAIAINLLSHPEFLQAQQVLIEALQPYPEARIAVSEALQALPRETS